MVLLTWSWINKQSRVPSVSKQYQCCNDFKVAICWPAWIVVMTHQHDQCQAWPLFLGNTCQIADVVNDKAYSVLVMDAVK